MDKHQEEILDNRHMEDEIDLWELIQVVWRYKWLIVILFVVAVGTSILVSKMMTPVYKVSANLAITRPDVIAPSELATVLKVIFKEKTSGPGSKNYPLKNPVIKYRVKSNLVSLTFRTTQPEKAPEILKEEITKIVKNENVRLFNAKYKYDLKTIEEKIKAEGNKLIITERDLAKNSKRLSALEDRYNILKQQKRELQEDTKQGMLPGLILIQNEISALKRALYSQNIDLTNTKNLLKTLELQKERILNLGKETFVWALAPHSWKRPVRPRPLLYMAIAGVLALFVGVFLAFFIEFIRKNRAKPVSG